jgi:UDP-N-acetylmuramoyl-L-alanyl-D-glutamate--2,6-diaminopimelate ligase
MTSLAAIVQALEGAGLLLRAPDGLPGITGLTADTRRLEPGALFCAVRGSVLDGHRFLGDAAAGGAVAALVEASRDDLALPQIVVRDGRRAAAVAAETWFDRPAERLTLVGVTGTNGKTTTVTLGRHVLSALEPFGSMGTLGAFDHAGAVVASEAGSLTTPGPIGLHQTFAEFVRRGTRGVAMEVSSHSLDQGRVDGLHFQAAIFTNITRDHLDYHPTLEDYFQAKARLLDHVAPHGLEVVNADDPAWKRLRRSARRRIHFGERAGEVTARLVKLSAAGARFTLVTPTGDASVRLPLLGGFNVANALGVAACAWGLGLEVEAIAQRLADAPQVPGRMERLAARPCTVLRDYAHTADAIERAIETVRPLTPGRVIVLSGAGGDRDRGKRAPMGEAMGRLADVVILAVDNPRTEDPDRIFDDLAAGLGGRPHERFHDRRDGIARALSIAREGDTVLLLGKGHETYQIIGTQKIPFDERRIVRELGGQ